MKWLFDRSGQSQILAAVAIGTVMMSAALYSLEYAQLTQQHQVRGTLRTEMRTVLDLAVKRASYLYHGESGCDPISLDNKLARINTDGTVNAVTANIFTQRQILLTVNNRQFLVSYGPVTRIKWRGTVASMPTDPTVQASGPTVGFSQDAVLEVWTTFGSERVSEMASLINNCTYPCSVAGISDQCQVATDPEIAYHEIVAPASFPGSAGSGLAQTSCVFSRSVGDIKVPPSAGISQATLCTTAPTTDSINVDDIIALKNYLRSGDSSGSCDAVLSACADFNNDGQVDEMDLNILEKLLRGYLYWVPAHYKQN